MIPKGFRGADGKLPEIFLEEINFSVRRSLINAIRVQGRSPWQLNNPLPRKHNLLESVAALRGKGAGGKGLVQLSSYQFIKSITEKGEKK